MNCGLSGVEMYGFKIRSRSAMRLILVRMSNSRQFDEGSSSAYRIYFCCVLFDERV